MSEPPVIVRAQDLGDVALKLLGLGLLFFAVMSIPSPFILASLPNSSARRVVGQTTYGVVYLVLGVCLTKWSSKLSGKLFGSVATAEIPLPVAAELQTIAFRVMGIYVLSSGLPMLAQGLVEASTEDLRLGASMMGFVGTQVTLGIVLLLYRSPWVLQFWKRLRPSRDRTATNMKQI